MRGMYRVPSGEVEVHCARGVGVLVVGVATRVPFVLVVVVVAVVVPLGFGEKMSLPSLVVVVVVVVVEEGGGGVVDEEEDKGVWAKSCLAARKLLRNELVSSRLERNAPGLRMMEGPPETILLCSVYISMELLQTIHSSKKRLAQSWEGRSAKEYSTVGNRSHRRGLGFAFFESKDELVHLPRR